ncbi:hypothetical protein Tco_0546296 [Tanacetum coccineum]
MLVCLFSAMITYLEEGLESVSIRRIQGIGYGVLEFLGVGTTHGYPESCLTIYGRNWSLNSKIFKISSVLSSRMRAILVKDDDHQDDDAPPEGEKRVKRQKTSKSFSKSVRGSSSKQSVKDSTTYVSKKQQQEEWDAWVEETIIDEDEVIPKDETPELIIEFQNVDKRVPTMFDRVRMEDTLNE